MLTKSVAYCRTSSATNLGDDSKESLNRQKDEIASYAGKNNYQILETFYDAAVKGTDSVDAREKFSEMLRYMQENGIHTILVENATRFARDLIVQLTGHDFLKKRGITLICVDAPDYFTNETPTAVLIRQVLGAVSQFEKAMIVDKMKKARDRKRRESGRCEGRKPADVRAIRKAKKLHREGKSLRAIAYYLERDGFTVILNGKPSGKRYEAASVSHMLRTRIVSGVAERVEKISCNSAGMEKEKTDDEYFYEDRGETEGSVYG